MSIAATVLIPTHNHGALLEHAVGTALAQTVTDLEVFVVGDGVPDETRSLMKQLMERDARLKFFDHPKGPRHGEEYRHQALSGARGRIVCYLSDDDLWLPDHVEKMLDALTVADFAHALPLQVGPDQELFVWTVDIGHPMDRALLLSGTNRIPLSCGGHTLESYRRLPSGWRTTPMGIPTDIYMWQQFLVDPACRAASETFPTVIHFAGSPRAAWSNTERLSELERWRGRLDTLESRLKFTQEVVACVAHERAHHSLYYRAELDRFKTEAMKSTVTVERAKERIERLEFIRERDRAEKVRLLDVQKTSAQHIRQLEDALHQQTEIAERSSLDLGALQGTLTWRLREGVLQMPGVRRLVQSVRGKKVRSPQRKAS